MHDFQRGRYCASALGIKEKVGAQKLLQQVLYGEEEILRFRLPDLVKGLPHPTLAFLRLQQLYQGDFSVS